MNGCDSFFVVVALPLEYSGATAHQVGKDGVEPSSVVHFLPWGVWAWIHARRERVKQSP